MKLLHIGLCVNYHQENGFQKAFKDVLGRSNYAEISTADKHINSNIMNTFIRFKPDIVFLQIQADGIVSNQTLDFMKSQGAYVINWTGDIRNSVPQWMLDSAPFVNCTAFSNMRDVREMRSKGYHSEYLEIGYDPQIYYPKNIQKDIDIVFMGNNYSNTFPLGAYRIEMVRYLKSIYGSRLKVFGQNWDKYGDGNLNHSQHEEADVYRRSKIAISLSHYEAERYASDRMLRILGSGVCCISHKYPSIEEDYIDGYHLATFNTLRELKERIDHLLASDQREYYAQQGHNLVLNRNTFRHQVENIIKLAQ